MKYKREAKIGCTVALALLAIIGFSIYGVVCFVKSLII